MLLKFVTSLSSILFVMELSDARGPHHPPGQPIVKRHVHYTPGKTAKQVLQDEQLIHDRAHLEEHLAEQNMAVKPDLSKMTDDELDLYYFLLHDSDKNSKLDGLELLQAIIHTTHEYENDDDTDDRNGARLKLGVEEGLKRDFQHFVELIDDVLREDDENQDGFISFAEYVAGRKRSQKQEQHPSVELI